MRSGGGSETNWRPWLIIASTGFLRAGSTIFSAIVRATPYRVRACSGCSIRQSRSANDARNVAFFSALVVNSIRPPTHAKYTGGLTKDGTTPRRLARHLPDILRGLECCPPTCADRRGP